MPYGNNTKTQFIHIDDLIRTFESAIYNENSCEIYNVTNPDIVSWEDFIMICGEILGTNPIIKKIDARKIKLETRTYFPFRDVKYMLDIQKLKDSNLYVPVISLKKGIRKTYEWYIDKNPMLNDPKMNKVDELVKN